MGIYKMTGIATLGLLATLSQAVDTMPVKDQNAWSLDVRSTFHRDDEDRTYVSFDGRMGVRQGWEVGLRGTFAKVGNAKTPTAIRSGGSDWEFVVRHALQNFDRLSLMAGVSFPNTPAQSNAFFTYGASYQLETGEGQPQIFVGGRGVMRKDSSLLGLSGSAVMPLQSGLELFGDFTVMVVGNNTFSSTGARERRALYGLGLRYTPVSNSEGKFDGSFYLMFTNQLGTTTGTSLTPALGNRPSLAVGVTFRGRS